MDSASEDILLKQVVKIENVMDDWQYGQQYNSGASSDVADPRKDPNLGTTATKEEPGTSETEKDPASIIAAVKTEPGTCEKDPASVTAAVKTLEPGTCEKDPASIIAAVKTEPDSDTATFLYSGESLDRSTVSYSVVKEDVRVKCEERAEEKTGHSGLIARDRIENCDDSSQSKKSMKLESDETEILPFCKPKQQDAEISQVCKQESSEFISAAYSKELVDNNIRLSPPHTVACSAYSLLTAKPVSVAEPTSLMPVVHSQISLITSLKNNAQVARDRPVTTTNGDQLREPQTVWTVKAVSACATTSPKEPASVKSPSSTTAKTSKQKQPVVLLVDSQYGLCVPDQRLADKLCQKGQDPVSANKLITADPIRVSYVTGKAAVNNSTPGKKDSVVMLKTGASEDKKTKGSPTPAMETFLVQMPGQSNEHSAPSSNHPPRTVQTSQTNFLVQMPGQSVEHKVSSSNQQPKSSLQISQQQLLKISEAISAVRKIQQKPDHAETAYEKFFVNFSTGTTVQGIEETAVAKHKPSILQRPALSGSELLLKTQHSSSGTSKDSGKSLLKSAGIKKGLSKSGQIRSTPQRSTSTPQGNWTSRQKVTSPISSRSSFVTTDGAANTKSKNTGVNSQQVSSRGSAQSDKVQAAKQTFEACLECFSFIPVSQMQKHVTACHPQGVSIVYKCPSCPAVFKSLSAQEQHTKQHTMQSMQENIEIVDNCDGESNVTDDWSDESSQEDESIQDDDNAEDNASVDEKAEENPQDVDVSAAEEENLAEEEQFFCCVCGRGYPSSERWMRHRLSKHPQVRHLDCEICGEFYKISGTGPESGKRRKLSGSFCTICQTDVNENLILHIQREHEQPEPDSSDTDTTSSDGETDNDTDSEYGDESAKKTDRKKADDAARKNSNDKETAGRLQESKSQLEGEHEHDKSKPSVSVREDSTASNVKPASCSENKSLAVTTSNTQNKQAELSQKRAKDNTQRQTDTTGNSSDDAARQAKARVNAAVYRCPLCGSAFPQTTDLLQHMGTHAGYGEYIQRCATAYAE